MVSQETYPPPVLMAIKKNFQHKKNIFDQFVTFNENDKAFIPNKEVITSDWTVDDSDKIHCFRWKNGSTFHALENAPKVFNSYLVLVHKLLEREIMSYLLVTS